MTRARPPRWRAIGLHVVAAFALSGTIWLSGCGAGAKACAIVDLADHACSVLRYLEDDGTVREVPVSRAEAREFGRAAAKKRAAAAAADAGGATGLAPADAGVDGGAP